MLDIIISTLNEEGYIEGLLKCLEKQTYKDFKIYLSDGNSTDKTVEKARKYTSKLPLTIIVDKKRGLAHQRNIGGNAGTSPNMLFLDADVILPSNFLAKLMKKVDGRSMVNCWISPISDKTIDKVLFFLYNLLALEVVRYICPIGIGGCLYTKRNIFEARKGFKENLAFWEDIDFIRRSVKDGTRFTILRSPKVYLSVRRFEVEGRINYLMQNLKGLLYLMSTGKIPKEDLISYPMDLNYADLLKNKKHTKKRLTKILKSYTIYLKVLKKIHSVSLDSQISQTIINQLLDLPLLKKRKNEIKKLLRVN